MQFETIDGHSAQDRSAGSAAATTRPYETERQARADVAGVYAQCARSGRRGRRGVMGEANLAYLCEACDRTTVTLGAFDTRIVAWLPGWEPETCAVVAGLVTRAYAAGLSAADSTGALAERHYQDKQGPR